MSQDQLRNRIQTVAMLGTYTPRQCGIATFTKDLREAIAGEIRKAIASTSERSKPKS